MGTMIIDLYKSAIDGSKYLSDPEGKNVAELPADLDPELRNLSLFRTKLDTTPDFSGGGLITGIGFIKLDGADVTRQIEAKGYGIHTVGDTLTIAILEEPPR
jgi:hypothetical protein